MLERTLDKCDDLLARNFGRAVERNEEATK